MESIIIYKSNTGYTKQYAQMLQTRIGAQKLIEIKEINKKELNNYDNIIFMAPINGNKILKIKSFLKYYKKIKAKNIFIFGVGLMPDTEERKNMIVYTNKLHKYHIRLYLILGGFDIERFPKFKRKLMKIGINLLSKVKPEISYALNRSVNFVSEENLDKMVNIFYKIN